MNFYPALVFFVSMSTTMNAADFARSQPTNYATGYRLAQTGDKPLLVLVTATWCAPCQQLKKTTIKEMLARRGFADFHFAMVDVDQDPLTAQQLTENRPVPQFIIFEKNGNEWKRRYSVGYLGVADLKSFLSPSIHRGVRTASTASANR
jgi:thioredoxin-related protein